MEKTADREKERGRERKSINVAGLTGFPPLPGAPSDSAQSSPASPVTQVRHLDFLLPLD